MTTLFDTHVLLGMDRWLSVNQATQDHALDLAGVRMALTNATKGSDWRAAVFPFPSASNPDYRIENDTVMEAARADSRLLPVAVANPNSSSNIAYLHKRAASRELAGIMIWPILCNLDLGKLAENDSFWDFVAEHDLPVTIHIATGDEHRYRPAVARNSYGPEQAVSCAEARPDIRFNLSHALRLSKRALVRAAALKNVWTDVSGYSSFGRWFEQGEDIFGAADPIIGADEPAEMLRRLQQEFGLKDRIMFGSSEPFCRWWGFSCERERDLYSQAKSGDDVMQRFTGAAEQFYKNWTGANKSD